MLIPLNPTAAVFSAATMQNVQTFGLGDVPLESKG
jgi:hypothetical protein